jgi:hypothetical protein
MLDRTSKFFLALIALGLWANILLVVLGPNAAVAQSPLNPPIPQVPPQTAELRTLALDVQNMARDISSISLGVCSNRTLCPGIRTP